MTLERVTAHLARLPADAPRQAAEPFAGESLGAGGAVGGLGGVALEVGVAAGFDGLRVRGPDWATRARPTPGDHVTSGGEPDHVLP